MSLKYKLIFINTYLIFYILGFDGNQNSTQKSRRQEVGNAVLPQEIVDFISKSREEQKKIMQMVTSLTTKTKATVEEGEDEDIEIISFPFDDEEEFAELLSRLEDRTFRKKID